MVVVYLVRHAEAKHNIFRDAPRDPHLTQVGKQQAYKLRDEFDDVRMRYVFSSPLMRARYTAAVVFRMYPVCFHELREQCEIRKPSHFLADEPLFDEPYELFSRRVQLMINYLRTLDGPIAVVSHARTIHEMLRQVGNEQWLGNCEYIKIVL